MGVDCFRAKNLLHQCTTHCSWKAPKLFHSFSLVLASDSLAIATTAGTLDLPRAWSMLPKTFFYLIYVSSFSSSTLHPPPSLCQLKLWLHLLGFSRDRRSSEITTDARSWRALSTLMEFRFQETSPGISLLFFCCYRHSTIRGVPFEKPWSRKFILFTRFFFLSSKLVKRERNGGDKNSSTFETFRHIGVKGLSSRGPWTFYMQLYICFSSCNCSLLLLLASL